MLLVLISVGGWVDPSTILRLEGFYVNEKTLTPTGIEPASFQFVAQHFNHCATAVPSMNIVLGIRLQEREVSGGNKYE